MLSLLNDILTNYVLPGLILAFGLCFLFVFVPEGTGLRGYRMARRMMGFAYLAFFVALIIEAMGLQLSMPPVLGQMMMVFMGIVQAFLFTFALTTLVDVQFFTWRRFVREFLLIGLPTATAFVAFPFFSRHLLLFALLAFFYGCKLIAYVLLFRRRYREYRFRMGNYFSADEWQRLRWVRRSFYFALSIGILALLYAIFPSVLTSLLFTLVMASYYAAFGIRFVGYAFTFQQIETAIATSHSTLNIDHLATPEDTPSDNNGQSSMLDDEWSNCKLSNCQMLMSCLASLMTEKRLFLKPDLTIEEVAVEMGESYRTVSAAINSCEGINFKAWVNGYRVEEAKRLIREGFLTDHVMDALATASGFASRISFYRAFKKSTGQSPTEFSPND